MTAGLFAMTIDVWNAAVARAVDADAVASIGAAVPFSMTVVLAEGFFLATPFLVCAISGSTVVPACSGGLVGAYALRRAAASRPPNRYVVGAAGPRRSRRSRPGEVFGPGSPKRHALPRRWGRLA